MSRGVELVIGEIRMLAELCLLAADGTVGDRGQSEMFGGMYMRLKECSEELQAAVRPSDGALLDEPPVPKGDKLHELLGVLRRLDDADRAEVVELARARATPNGDAAG